MVARFKDGTFVYPAALFRLTPEELTAATERGQRLADGTWVGSATGDDASAAGDADEVPFDAASEDELRDAA
jgi:hypothetical protein